MPWAPSSPDSRNGASPPGPASGARSWRPLTSSTSAKAFSAPTVTSATGCSTVVGASPRWVWRHPSGVFWNSSALVVVEPQSVTSTVRSVLGSVFMRMGLL